MGTFWRWQCPQGILQGSIRPVNSTKAGGPASRIPSLDGLRALSIVLVLFGHMSGAAIAGVDAKADLGFASGLANLGVRVFFVISGYLITTLLIAESEKTGRIDLGKFYLRRTFRIFPAYYFYLLVIGGASAITALTVTGRDIVYALTYTMNMQTDRSWSVGHAWSLSVEEQFYLLWPVAVRYLGHRFSQRLALATIALCPLIRLTWAAALPEHHGLIGEAFPTVADTIATGCVMAGIRHEIGDVALWRRLKPLYRLVSHPAVLLALPVLAIVIELNHHHARPYWLVGETALNVSIALLVNRVIRSSDDLPGRLLNWGPLVWVGTLSYSIYLWQQPFMDLTRNDWTTSLPTSLGLMLAAACFSFYFVEKPILALRRTVEKRLYGTKPKPEATPKVAGVDGA